MQRQKNAIYKPLVKSSSHSTANDTPRMTSADRISLASQNNEGRFKSKHSKRVPGKKIKSHQDRMDSCKCACCASCACCPHDELEAIEEEHEPEERLAKLCEKAQEPLFGGFDPSAPSQSCPKCNPNPPECKTSPSPGEEEPNLEFFDIMRCMMEEAVKNSLEGMLGQYLTCCMEKIDNLAYQMKHNECILTKIYTDLDEKISYYGQRNAEQFKYLCLRMEQDQLFYQRQQEFLIKCYHGKSQRRNETKEKSGDEEDLSNEETFKSTADKAASREDLPTEETALKKSSNFNLSNTDISETKKSKETL